MSRRGPRSKPDLTASWASSVDSIGPEAGVQSIVSEEAHSDYEPRLSQSQSRGLSDALRNTGDSSIIDSSPRWAPTLGVQQSFGDSLTQSTDSPAKSPRVAEPGLIMPSVTNLRESQRFAVPQQSPSPSRRRQGQAVRQSKPNMQRAAPKMRKADAKDEDYVRREDGGNYLSTIWKHVLGPTFQYLLSILGVAFKLVKPLLTYGLALWLLVGLFIMVRNFLTNSVTNALTPICRIPGSSLLNLPFCAQTQHPPLPANNNNPIEFAKLVSAQSSFEDVLTTAAGGSSLPLDMKHSESSIRDLKHVVQYSTLPSRNELVFEFGGFIDTARAAAADLTRYNSRIARAVDRILTTNRWTLQVLDGIAADANASNSPNGLTRALSALNIFSPFLPAPGPTPHAALLAQYLRHTALIEDQISALILEAQALLRLLDNLDARLDVIASIAARDDVRAQGTKDELFATLWTRLGGNRNSVAKLDAQLALLRNVSAYRKMAWAHVAGTVVKLQEISASLEDLRERVAGPEVLGSDKVEELPLEMHVREIVLGVERLERVRDEGRRIEDARIRRILDGGERVAEIGAA